MKLLTKANIAMLSAEFFGAILLVMMFLVLTHATTAAYFVATSVAATMGVIYVMFSAVSGAHANPAVTFGMWTARKIGTVRGIAYIIAQVLGGYVAWQLYQYLIDTKLPKYAATSFDWRVFVAEMLGTLIFAMGFAAVVSRKYETLVGGLMLAGALFVGVLVAATAAHGYVNPAVALGLSNFHFDWAYILGPLAGGLVGVNLFNELYGSGSTWLSKVAPSKKRK